MTLAIWILPLAQISTAGLIVFLAMQVARAESALLANLRRTPQREDSASVRDARVVPRAALTALWLCRDTTLAAAVATGLILTPDSPWNAAFLVLLAWAASMVARKRAKKHPPAMQGRIWTLVGLLLPLSRALRVMGQDAARRQTSGDGDNFAEDEENVAWAHELEPDDRDLLANVRSFGSRSVHEVMTPRVDIFSLPIDISAGSLIAKVDEARFARVPICRDNDEEIAGILYVKDLLGHKLEDDFDLEALLHPVEIVAPDTQVDTAFREFKRRKTHLGMVFDDLGSLIGLVTMEDLLEELFGEIRDEGDDHEIPDYVRVGDNLLVSGRLPVQELAKLLDRPIETDGSASTVGGLLMAELGRIPRVAETVQVDGLRFVVERREGTVLRRVRVEPVS
jgi:CBS domain containing-hemolysin-like protein